MKLQVLIFDVKMECCCCFEVVENNFHCLSCKTTSCIDCLTEYCKNSSIFPRCMGHKCAERLPIYRVITLLGVDFFKKNALPMLIEEKIQEENDKITDTQKIIEDYNFNLQISKRIHEINYQLISRRPRPSPEEELLLQMELIELQEQNQKNITKIENEKEEKTTTKKINCPNSNCSGILLSNGNCSGCKILFCKICLEKKEESHECKKEVLENLNFIRQSYKECPRCGVPIEKKSGCDHMFCTKCLTPFNWNDLKITNNFANPHYFEMVSEGRIPDMENNTVVVTNCETFNFKGRYMIREKHYVDKITEYLRDRNNEWDPARERIQTVKSYGEFLTGKIKIINLKKSFGKIIRKKIYLQELRDSYLAIQTFFRATWSLQENEAEEIWRDFYKSVSTFLEKLHEAFGFAPIISK